MRQEGVERAVRDGVKAVPPSVGGALRRKRLRENAVEGVFEHIVFGGDVSVKGHGWNADAGCELAHAQLGDTFRVHELNRGGHDLGAVHRSLTT